MVTNPEIDKLFSVGAHYAFAKSRRHPSAKPFIFGTKDSIEIFDLEKTVVLLEEAKEFVKKLAAEGKQMLFVGTKAEARAAMEAGAIKAGQPYVTKRWVGGSLTNFAQMRKRVARLEDLKKQREKGELAKYTKKEKLLIDREIEDLEERFGGIADMEGMPGALFIVDTREEDIAVAEAVKKGIPIVALIGSDCDGSKVAKPVFANDSSKKSIEYFVNEIAEAYKEGKLSAPKKEVRREEAPQASIPERKPRPSVNRGPRS